MEPLSVSLAVIALVTAVKDLVECVQKIQESFAKVSKNHRKAQRIADNIEKLVKGIKVFCEDHKNVLENMKDFSLALQGLRDKFRVFESSILPLLPPMGERRRDVLIRGWREWRNGDKFEEAISDLQNDIMSVIQTHMINYALRTEVKLEEIHQEASRGREALDIVRRDISAMRITATSTTTAHRSDQFSVQTSNEFDQNIIMFAQSTPSTSVPMLRTPDITEELMSAAYIKLQINDIAIIVQEMSMLPTFTITDDPTYNVDSFLFHRHPKETVMGVASLQRHLVRQVAIIRDFLETKRGHTISILYGHDELNRLSNGLFVLGLLPEAILVGNWAITLARMLVNAEFGSRALGPSAHLALYLYNRSIWCLTSGDSVQSLQAIVDAHTITQDLRKHYAEDGDLQIMYSTILLQYAKLDNQRSTAMTMEAVQVLEDILRVRAFSESNDQIVEKSASFLDHQLSSAPAINSIMVYAAALQGLGICSYIDGHPERAIDFHLLSIDVLRKVVSIHGDEHKGRLASGLLILLENEVADCIHEKTLISIAEECIQLFQGLAKRNPPAYARSLFSALWRKANALVKVNQLSEAIAAFEEAASLAEQIIQDSQLYSFTLRAMRDQFNSLKRYDDAVQMGKRAVNAYHGTVEHRQAIYSNLFTDLRELRRDKESAEAIRMAVTLCRHLAIMDSSTWLGPLTAKLARLSCNLAALGRYSESLIPWEESVRMVDNFLHTQISASSPGISDYIAALTIQGQCIGLILQDEEESTKVCSTAAEQLRQLSEILPKDNRITLLLWSTERFYAYNMLRFGRLQNARQYIDNRLDLRSSSEVLSESDISFYTAELIIEKVHILDSQGCTNEALLATQQGREIVTPFITTDWRCFRNMIKFKHHEARLQEILGDDDAAFQVADGAAELVQDSKLEQRIASLFWCFHAVALTALLHQNYGRSIEFAQEACKINERFQWEKEEDEFLIRPSLFAILSSAEANLGNWSTAVEYAHRAVEISQEIGKMKYWISATTAEHSYMEARGNLAEILLATGDLTQARKICEERSAYFSKRVDTRKGDYRELAPILRMLGILCCSEGRHEEGNTAAQELSRIMKALGSAFLSLQEEVKTRLRRQATVPILKVLDDMSEKLECRHQASVASLLAA